MTDKGFEIRTKRWSAVVWAPVGLAFLYLAIDLKFLHLIPGATDEAGSWMVFLILTAIGAGIVFPAVRAILKPRTLLAVDGNGITISAAGDRSEWNNETGKMEPVICYGEERHIPWKLVERIEAGTIERTAESQTRGTVVSRTDASTTRIGGQAVQHSRACPALRILCSRDVSMELITVRNIIHARTGDAPGDITAEDRAHFSPTEIEVRTLSEFLIDVRLLPASVEHVVEVMQKLKSTA